jgi:teichoic acid transport system ATP-binding protein
MTATETVKAPVTDATVVVDNASLTYTVRGASKNNGPRSLLQRIKGVAGVSEQYVEALKPLSLVVRTGEAVGVIGTNGSGKSTLMKLLTGHLPPTQGAIYATSTPIMLGVNAALVKQISGYDNITLGCLAMGMTRKEVEEKRAGVIELSGLDDRALQLPMKAYSSGMASRLQFAIATSMDPEILIIDEALNTGDAQFRERTGARIDELRSQAGSVFLVSHSLPTIREMTNRCIWIQQGELVMDDDPAVVTKAYHGYTKRMARKEYNAGAEYLAGIREDYVQQSVVWA